jgi:hypothetical protein
MNQNLRCLLPMILFLCIGCQKEAGDAATDPTGLFGAETDFSVLLQPERGLDILFMVDNSSSMDPKQKALATYFPAMIQQLEKLPGGLPDIHIGVISSDFGAGEGEIGGSCGSVLGNRGLLWGNDNSATAMAGITGAGYNQFATVANIANGCGLNQGARWIADVQDPTGAGRVKNYTGSLTDVFSCLAKAVGTKGCGLEHQLQSVRIALNPQNSINDANMGFLRPKAKLAIVLLTDEDDCSADPYSATDRTPNNDGMFTPKGLTGETTGLRCAGRGHVCNGQAIPNYDSTNGYDGSQGPLSLNFADCAAKDPKNPPDYHWLPLIPVQTIIDDVIQVKNGNRDNIFVAGIIGWPQSGDFSSAKYRIDKDASSSPASLSGLWDYMPICSIPSVKSEDGNIYKAYGGLRLKKFIDGFGDNGKTYSICNNDFTEAMTDIAAEIAKKFSAGCVEYPLLDSDPSLDGVQPGCQAMDLIPCDNPKVGRCSAGGYEETVLLSCKDAAGLPLNPDGPQLDSIPEANRPCWIFSYDKGPYGCAGALQNQRISVLRRTGIVVPAGTRLDLKCRTQPSPVGNPSPSTTTRKPLGATCDVGAEVSPPVAVYNSTTQECAGGLCLKPMASRYFSSNRVDTNPYCTATCSNDSDCKGLKRDPNNSNDKTCQNGYTCGVEFVTGSLCCKKLCICKDFLDGPLALPLTCDPSQNNGATGCN